MAAGTQGSGMPDPIHQFEIHRIIPIKIFGWDASFTNSSLFMLLAVLLIAGFFVVPVVGLFVGFVLGVYVAERQRVGGEQAWPSTKAALRSSCPL